MDKDIKEFMSAFRESDECKRIMRDGTYSIGCLSRAEVIECAKLIASDYCDAQLRAYHRWMTSGELP